MNSTGNCCHFLPQSPTPTTHPDFSVLSPPEIIPVNTALVVPTATARLELQGQRLPVSCSSLYLEHLAQIPTHRMWPTQGHRIKSHCRGLPQWSSGLSLRASNVGGWKIMTNLDSLICRDITFKRLHIKKQRHHFANKGLYSHSFLVVMYGYESWTIKKAEYWRTDAFK